MLEQLWVRIHVLQSLLEAAQLQKIKCMEVAKAVYRVEEKVQGIEDTLMAGKAVGPKKLASVQTELERLEKLLKPSFPNL